MRRRRAIASRQRGEAPQLLHQRRQHSDDAIDIVLGVALAEAEADRAERARVWQAHRLQHVRRFERARRARRARRHRDALEIEADEQRLRLDPFEADVGRIRDARFRRAVPLCARDRREDAQLEPIAERAQARAFFAHLLQRELGGRRRGRRCRERSPSRAAIALLPAAGHRAAGAARRAAPERADAFRSVELVRGDREQIDAQRLHVDRDLARRLHRIGMQQRAVLVRDRRELRDRLNRSDLVVRVHHATRAPCRSVIASRSASVETMPLASTGSERHAPAAPRQRLERVEHRLVFDRAGDQMLAPAGSSASAAPRIAKLSPSVPPRGEDHLRRLRRRSRAATGRAPRRRGFGLLPEMVDAGRVAPDVPHRLVHPVGDRRGERGRRVVIEVDAHPRLHSDRNIPANSQQ